MCAETVRQFVRRMLVPATEAQFQRAAKVQLRVVHSWAAEHRHTVIRRTAARGRAIVKAFRNSGFRQIRLNRSQKHGVWTVKMQIGAGLSGIGSHAAMRTIQIRLQTLGYAVDRNAVYAVVFRTQVCAGFVLLKP